IGHPISYEPSSTGLPRKPWPPFLGPPIVHAASAIGQPISYDPSSTGLPHKPRPPFLGPPIAHVPFSIGRPLPFLRPPVSHAFASVSPSMPCWCYSLSPLSTPRFQFLGPPIAYHYISMLHITYCYILSYCTLG
ncbi:hypothetical protein PAXRUDRAFT_121021, partial [Paxillus rubicundulus Ve08.2h10]